MTAVSPESGPGATHSDRMSASEDPSELARLPLFSGLAPEELDRVARLLRRRTFPTGSRIISAQQPGEALYVLLAGSVKISIDREDGTEVTLALLGPGDTIGEMSLVEKTERSANVVTMEDSTFLWMDRASFLALLEEIPQLTHNLVRQLSERLRAANEKIQALSTLDVAGRVSRQLLAFADQYGKPDPSGDLRIPLPLTQSDIAEMVGATRERVNRVMVELRQAGAISVDARHHITVHERTALQQRGR